MQATVLANCGVVALRAVNAGIVLATARRAAIMSVKADRNDSARDEAKIDVDNIYLSSQYRSSREIIVLAQREIRATTFVTDSLCGDGVAFQFRGREKWAG